MGYYTELDAFNLDEPEQHLERNGDYDDFYEEVVEHIAAKGAPGLSYLKKVVEEGRMDVPQLCAMYRRRACLVVPLVGNAIQ